MLMYRKIFLLGAHVGRPLITYLCEGVTFSGVVALVGQYTTHPQTHDKQMID